MQTQVVPGPIHSGRRGPMTEIGYALSSEEHTPADLARYVRRAEEAGFDFALISDHYHPWIDRQGQSSFVWAVIGAISQVEHILGDHWPPSAVRREMLEEAVEVIRLLWRGGSQSHRGRHYTVENASGPKAAELALPAHFEAAVAHVEEQDVAEGVACGPDPQRHVEAITEFVDAGYDHVYLHQIGPEQDGFFDFHESEVLPKLDGGGRKG
jgi:hypothetical protein